MNTLTMGERMIYAAEFVRELAAHGPAKAAFAAWGAVMTFRFAPIDDPQVKEMWRDMVSGQNDNGIAVGGEL